MSRFYGPGKSGSKPQKPEGPPNVKVGLNFLGGEKSPQTCMVIRFVLKSGAALELKEDTIEEVVGGWADRMCSSIAGYKVDGTKVLIPIASVDYAESEQ